MMRQRGSRVDAEIEDSFLDIVTNIVGILIILVMVIGARVQSISLKPKEVNSPNLENLMMEVVRLEDAVVASESELVDLDEQGRQLAVTVADAGNARIHLATAVSATKREVEDQKQRVQKDKAKQVEMAAQSQRIKDEIEQCNLEAEGIAHAPQTRNSLPIQRQWAGQSQVMNYIFALLQGVLRTSRSQSYSIEQRHALSVKVADP